MAPHSAASSNDFATAAPRAFEAGCSKLARNDFQGAKQDFLLAATEPGWRNRALKAAAATHIGFHNVAASADDAAMRCCRALVEEFPNDTQAWLALGECWLDVKSEELGDAAQALHCFQQAAKLAPRETAAWYGLGCLQQHRGALREAIDAYSQVLALEPEHVAARFRLWVLMRQGAIGSDNSLAPLAGPGPYLKDVRFADLAHCSPREFDALRTSHAASAVLFRSVLPADKLRRAAELTTEFAAGLDYLAITDIAMTSAPLELQSLLTELIREHLVPKILPLISPWAARGWEPFANRAWWLQYYVPDSIARGRLGRPCHQDHPLHCQQSNWSTFWTPLVRSAPGVAACMRVLTVPLRQPIDPLERSLGRINAVPFRWMCDYFEKALVVVSAEVGDVLSFGRHMLHETYFDAQMTHDRVSFDVRFMTGPSRFALDVPYALP